MNIDFIEASTFISKDKISLHGLNHISTNKWGWDNYSISYNNGNEMKVNYNNHSEQLKVSGSLPYFVDGQNFSNSIDKLEEAIYLISDTINADINHSEVKCFEFGTTFQIPFSTTDAILSHYSIKGMNTSCFKTGRLYEDALRQIKLYNAGIRLKQALTKEQRTGLVELGYNPLANYLRFESKYKKPFVYFKDRAMKLKDLFREESIEKFKQDLILTYNMINKEGNFEIPRKKRDCTLPVIELMYLKELGLKYGFNPEQCLKEKINSIPEAILSKEDKKNRKKSLNHLAKKLIKAEKSCFDVSDYLKASLRA